MFQHILPTAEDTALTLPGDERITNPLAVIDSGFDLPATPEVVFPWFLQLGKQRAGWYFPRWVERFMLPSRRGLRTIEPQWQNLRIGQRIPDYGGPKGYFDCFALEPNKLIGYTSTRGKLRMTWVLSFWPQGDQTRVVIRLRIASKSKLPSLLPVGKVFDRLTIAGLAAGLRERLSNEPV